MKRIALIDGNSLINRAYYAIRNPMITKDGTYTHAIFGFINILEKIDKDYMPEYMAIAFDLKAPTFRHEQYDEYKAGRKKMPTELAMQIPIFKDILDAMHITRIEVEGYEADDIIGTLARKSEAEGFEPLIFTGDKDQLQLATDITKIIYTKRGVSEYDLFDHDSFTEAYGFEPLQFIDYKGLAGDASDNIPGIPGVGAKTASKLIQEYGSVEDIIKNADEIKPASLQAKVKDNAQIAMMSKSLATIFTEVPFDTKIEDCLITEPDYDKLIEIYTKLEFNKFLAKLRVKRGGGDPGQAGGFESNASLAAKDFVKIEDFEMNTIDSDEMLNELEISTIEGDGNGDIVIKVFGDNNHRALPKVDGVAILAKNKYYYFNLMKLNGFYEWFSKLLSDSASDTGKIRFVGHNLITDYYMLMCNIKSEKEPIKYTTAFDTAIAQYVLDPARSNYNISSLSNEYLHSSIVDEKEIIESNKQLDMFDDGNSKYAEYGLQFCVTVLNLKSSQEAQIAAEKLETVLCDVELPLVEVMAAMEKEGFRTDRDFLVKFGDTLSIEIDALAKEIHDMAGEEFNINSPIQLGEILFDKLELPHGKKTKRGYSTGADILEKIKGDHPIIPAILQYRTLAKLKSTYVDGLLPLINTDDKIHAHFRQTVTTTGRISCTEPNLQNIPIKQELGRKLRKAFVPEPPENEGQKGCVLVGADYSQIELRVLAHMSGDEALIDAFNNGEDIHRATAAHVLGIPEDEITPAERSRAKAVNFGVIYGMSSFGLSGELNISRKEAGDYIDTYFAKHEQVKEFMDGSVEFAKANGYVTTLMGRKRYIKEMHAPNYMVRQIGERLAMNTPIQGSAADIIKLAMIKVYDAIREADLKSKLILQIHDELIINTYPGEVDTVRKLLLDNMQSAYKLLVELKADCNMGSNWYELK